MPDDVWRIATVNVRTSRARGDRASWRRRRSALTALLTALDTDVIGLQEARAEQVRAVARALPGHVGMGVGRDDGRRVGEHCTVLVRRHRARIVAHRTRWYGDHPDRPGSRLPDAGHPRIATLVELASPDGVAITVANTHLDHQHDGNRRRSVEQLLGWLDLHRPTVVLGDLNARPEAPEVVRLVEAGLTLAALPPGVGTFNGFTHRQDGPHIDHVLLSHHFELVDATAVTSPPGAPLPSDHWPLVVTARLAVPVPRPSPQPGP